MIAFRNGFKAVRLCVYELRNPFQKHRSFSTIPSLSAVKRLAITWFEGLLGNGRSTPAPLPTQTISEDVEYK